MNGVAVSGVPRQALVLAAGEGRRLRPHTARVPKPLMPVLNVPLLHHAIARLADAGVRRVAVNAWHLAEQIEAALAPLARTGLELHFEREPALLGTGGALHNLRAWIDEAPLLVVAGDVLVDVDLRALAARHARARADHAAVATMLLVDDDVARFGAVETDEHDHVCDIVGLCGRPGRRAAVNGSVHVLEPELLARLDHAPSCLIRDGYVPALVAGETCAAYRHAGAWHEIGNERGLLAAQRAALRGEPAPPASLAIRIGRRLPSPEGLDVLVHETARLEGDVTLLDGTVVGAGARVGSGAHLRGCLLLPGAEVAPGTRADGVVIGTPATEAVVP